MDIHHHQPSPRTCSTIPSRTLLLSAISSWIRSPCAPCPHLATCLTATSPRSSRPPTMSPTMAEGYQVMEELGSAYYSLHYPQSLTMLQAGALARSSRQSTRPPARLWPSNTYASTSTPADPPYSSPIDRPRRQHRRVGRYPGRDLAPEHLSQPLRHRVQDQLRQGRQAMDRHGVPGRRLGCRLGTLNYIASIDFLTDLTSWHPELSAKHTLPSHVGNFSSGSTTSTRLARSIVTSKLPMSSSPTKARSSWPTLVLPPNSQT